MPYKGNGPLVTDLVGGQVPAGIMTAGDIVQHQKSGQVKVIGVFGAKRSPVLPDVPTLIEQGSTSTPATPGPACGRRRRRRRPSSTACRRRCKQVLAMPDVRDILVNKRR